MGRRNSDIDSNRNSTVNKELYFFWSLWVALGVALAAGFLVTYIKYQSLLLETESQKLVISELKTSVSDLIRQQNRESEVDLENRATNYITKDSHNELRDRLKAELQKELRGLRRVFDREMSKFTSTEDISQMRLEIDQVERKIVSMDVQLSSTEYRIRSKLQKTLEQQILNATENLYGRNMPEEGCPTSKISDKRIP